MVLLWVTWFRQILLVAEPTDAHWVNANMPCFATPPQVCIYGAKAPTNDQFSQIL